MHDAIQDFREAIQSAGLVPPAVIHTDGEIHRFPTNEHGRDDAGWYVYRDEDVPSGAFGDWRTGVSQSWRGTSRPGDGAPSLPVRRRRSSQPPESQDVAQKARRDDPRQKAETIWKSAEAAPAEHPYLVAKGIGAHGSRLHGGALVVPMYKGPVLTSLQFIEADGRKRFISGGETKGCFSPIGKLSDTICLVEGFATGASIHEATGHGVAVAFSAGNLKHAAKELRDGFPDTRIVVCADDDAEIEGNPGFSKAREAATLIDALLAVPDFGTNRSPEVSDFNDLHTLLGPAAVQACVNAAKAVQDTGADPEGTWQEPELIVAELKPVPAFDAHTLLPEALREWVLDEAERMPCPPEFVAVSALVALGSIIGARCAIRPKSRDSWVVVPNLWGGIVGDPSAKKSPAWAAALAPLDRLIARASEAHQAELDDFEADKLVFEARREAIEKRVKTAASKGDHGGTNEVVQELRSHKEQAPEEPVLRRYKTNDTTVEKLGELLRQNPAGLLVLRDELVGLIASWEKEGREGDRAFFLEGWNGNQSFDTDRIGRGHISIPNVCVSVFGGIQPDKLRAYLETATHALANDGMLQRFQLLVYPDRRHWEWRDRTPNASARQAACDIAERLADFDPVEWGATPADAQAKFPSFQFSDEAQSLFIEWSEDLHTDRMPNEDAPIVQQHLAKYDKLFPALALIFHLVDGAATGNRGRVSKESALRAAAWCEFLEAHARRCYGLLMDDGIRAAQTLAAKITQGRVKDGFTVREIRRNQWRGLTTNAAIQAAVDWLEDEHWVRGEDTGGTGPGSGRRTTRYRINPNVKTKRRKG